MFEKLNQTARRFALMAIICLVSGGGACGETILHVDDDAPLQGDGQTWDTAFRHLQDALYAAQPGSGIAEIRIGQGLYKPDQDEAGNVVPGDRHATFQLIPDVVLKGGYAGFGAPDPDERDIALYETILTGDLFGDDPPDGIVSDENSYHVLTYTDERDLPGTLDGLTITHGLADGDSDSGGAGVCNRGLLVLSSCTFRANQASSAGGAVRSSEYYDLTVEGCTFDKNSGSLGGAVFTTGRSDFVGCEFVDNVSARWGGAIMFLGLLVLDECAFERNTAGADGGAVDCMVSGDVWCYDCVFIDNRAGYRGGAVSIGESREYGSYFVGCTFSGNLAEAGGAVRCGGQYNPKTLLVMGCQFLTNTATDSSGGAIYLADTPFLIRDVEFRANDAPEGGAIYLDWGVGDQSFDYCTFTANTAEDGGAIYSYGSSASVRECALVGNHAEEGGALCCKYQTVMLYRCQLRQNQADCGGAIHATEHGGVDASSCDFCGNRALASGGAVFAREAESVELQWCDFLSNTAQEGAAIWSYHTFAVEMTACKLMANRAVGHGGAAFITYSGSPDFERCWFTNNVAGGGGGALYASSSDADILNCLFSGNRANRGGALHGGFGDDTYITNCTLTQNYADTGGGACHNESGWPTLANCIIWDNGPDQITEDSGRVNVRYCDVEGDWTGQGEQNIDIEPRFRNPHDGEFHLRPGSPCIDAGNNTLLPDHTYYDLDGRSRWVDDPGVEDTGYGEGNIVDIGAYEVQDPSCPTDVNSDGMSDVADIIALYEAWGECGDQYDCPEDIDFDGEVDIDDVFAILGNWGPCPGRGRR